MDEIDARYEAHRSILFKVCAVVFVVSLLAIAAFMAGISTFWGYEFDWGMLFTVIGIGVWLLIIPASIMALIHG